MIAAQIKGGTNTSSPFQSNIGTLLKKLLLPNPVFELHEQDSLSRTEAEDYIAKHFKKIHGAQVCSFLPTLMTMRCKSVYSAAVGMRSAAQSELFLEQYLDTSVEKAIEKNTHKTVNRNEIVEIGNLVATTKGTSHLMFILIAAALIKTDNKWMVFTATGQVAKILRRLNFKTIILCEAEQSRLEQPEGHDQWGEYYSANPQVLAGDLTQVFDLIHGNRLINYVVKYYWRAIRTLSNHFVTIQRV
ncbi:hypothetical protein MNBD_GAMMA16-2050 [hydrothermal vent metagenome]|uniref:Thermostable hemolysin delta-VPH n=1 Tax=hydrothermal vent metagenome TaxID=652676 RepID=A0A3B0YRW3_9ZZZZ